MPTYVEYTLESGSTLLIEVDEPQGGVVKAARDRDGNRIIETRSQFTRALDSLRESALALKREIDALEVQEAEVKFGLKTTGEAGIFAVGKVGGEVNYEVTLRWKRM